MNQKLKKIILVGGDLIVLYLSLYLTLIIRYQTIATERWQQHFLPFSIIYGLWLIIFYIAGLYDLNLARNNIKFIALLSRTILIAGFFAIAFFYFIPYFGIAPKTNLFINLILFAGFFAFWRQIFNIFAKSRALLNNVLIIGQDKESKQIAEIIKENPQLGYKIAEMIMPEILKDVLLFKELLIKNNINTIIIGGPSYHQDENLVQALYQCLPLKINFVDLATFYEEITNKIPISLIGEIWFLENLMESKKRLYETVKRILDLIMTILLGIIALILSPFIIIAIKLDSKGPALFKQLRIGKNEKPFLALKFRSMFTSAEKSGPQWAKENDPRITKIGRFLRKTRLDELPQLWNILKGEMSFIGPRPERPEFVNELNKQIPYYQIRHLIKPGLSGWAQTNFPYGASIEDALEKLQYELFYLKNRSFVLDLGIALRTIKIIIQREGR